LDTSGVYHQVWAGTDPSQPGSPVNYTINFPTTTYQVAGARIDVSTDHDLDNWEEIDAVRLLPPMPDQNSLEATRGDAQDLASNNTLATALDLGGAGQAVGNLPAGAAPLPTATEPNDYFDTANDLSGSFQPTGAPNTYQATVTGLVGD